MTASAVSPLDTTDRPAESEATTLPFLGPRVVLSATPRYRDGETRPDEYVRELHEPTRRMETFDEMRQSDDAVNAAIGTRLGMLRAANWTLAAPSDKPAAKDVVAFVEDNVYPFLDQILGHLGEAIQYGFASIEPLMGWADRPTHRQIQRGKIKRPTQGIGRAIYLRDIVHVRQRTVRSFLLGDDNTPESGQLLAIRQFAYSGLGGVFRDIPTEKLLTWTYARRGDDYWGNPPLRACYKPWTFKNQLERLNLVGAERFGVGIPVVTAGPSWNDDDYARCAQFLEAFQANNSSYLVMPNGGTVAVLSSTGQLVMNVLEWVKFYTLAIHFQFLTHSTQLAANTETGARALGDTFVEQAESVSQADCEEIAAVLNERLLIPVVDANFGPQDEYPLFSPSQRIGASQQFLTTLTQLKAAGMITWGPREELWLRDATEMPEATIEELQAAADAKAAAAAAIAGQGSASGADGAKGATGKDGSGDPGAEGDATGQPGRGGDPVNPPAPPAKKPALRAATRRLSATEAPTPAPAGETWRTTQYSQWEDAVVRPINLGRALDLEQARLSGEVLEVLREIDGELAAQAHALALEGAAAIRDGINTVAVPASLRVQLRAVLTAAAERARAIGEAAVQSEVQRQANPDVARPARYTRLRARVAGWIRQVLLLEAQADGDTGDAGDEPTGADHLLDIAVERAVSDEIARRETAARNALLDALATAPAAEGAELAPIADARAKGALGDLSTGRTGDTTGAVVNIGFGIGRDDGATAIASAAGDDGSPLVAKIYSAVLDDGTCEACARWDGATFPIDYDSSAPGAVKAPNPTCAGTIRRCRCLWVYVHQDEAPTVIGPTAGPLADPRFAPGGVS